MNEENVELRLKSESLFTLLDRYVAVYHLVSSYDTEVIFIIRVSMSSPGQTGGIAIYHLVVCCNMELIYINKIRGHRAVIQSFVISRQCWRRVLQQPDQRE